MVDRILSYHRINSTVCHHKVHPAITQIQVNQIITDGGQMESRGCATSTIEMVQNEPSLILKFKEMATFVLVLQSLGISK